MSLRLNLYARELRDLPHDLRWGRRHGAVWAELRRRTLDQLYERGRFAVVEQDLDRALTSAPPPGVTVEVAKDLGVLADLAPRHVRSALARRETLRCVVAFSDGRAVGYDCWSLRLHPELDVMPVPLPAGTPWGHDIYVDPAARGMGIGMALASARIADIREHGFRRLRGLLEAGNVAARRTAERSVPHTLLGEAWFVKTPGRLRAGFDPA